MEQKTEASQAVDELVRACKAATSDAEKVAAIDAYRAAIKAQPAPTEAQDEPVAWFEAEPSAKGLPLREVIGGMIHSTRMHTTKPEVLNNALWPLYEHPAQGEDSARLDFFAPVVLDPACGCAKCNPRAAGRIMILCATCGNKRCPHATDHALACTNSNEPGQVGSSYGPAAPQPQEQP